VVKARSLDQQPVQATQLPLKIVKTEEVAAPPKIKRERVLPALDLLEGHTSESIAQDEIAHKKDVIENTLRQFGLEAKVVRVSQGPAVTQYGVEPGYIERPGVDGEPRRQKVRVAQISSLQNDLALALAAPSLRIEAPVPGQSFVGIEVPNDSIELVGLRRVLDSEAFGKLKAKAPLAFALGQDVSGMAIAADLAAMPHVLIAGTTGSGKTALARTMVASLALLNPQRSLQMVLVDPKGRGLSPFAGLPHLLTPVVSEVDEAIAMLRRLVAEMERRDAQARSEPRLVVVMDELADLLLVGGREMEDVLTRLTQRGREAGIHLIVSTQKPTVALMGGLIKSNFPVRLVGSVACAEDARVASGLAGSGAERLLGQGDFLVVVKGQVTRLQAAYLDAAEVPGFVAQVRQQGNGRNLAALPGDGDETRLLPATGTDGAATSLGRRIVRLWDRR